MMENKKIEDLFEELKGNFDVEQPADGHQQRFLDKLKANQLANNQPKKGFSVWKTVLAIAASLIIGFGILKITPETNETMDLASISPKFSEAQDFFTVTLETELKKLNQERSPLTEKIINDAFKQLDILEKDYENLRNDLSESNNDQRVIYAMISNFQNRIDLLTHVLDKIDDLKELKTRTNETKNTL